MHTYLSEPIKQALRSKPSDPLHFFREALADAYTAHDRAEAAEADREHERALAELRDHA